MGRGLWSAGESLRAPSFVHCTCFNPSNAKSQVDFGQSNGHYNVPPPIDRHDQDGARLYKWVQSLHMEHRALQSGQESTLLDDVGVSALLNIGFRFQI